MSVPSRLHLPSVTLCCVDSTSRVPWALKALQRCVEAIEFGDAVLCTDRASLGAHALPTGVRWVEIEPLTSIEAYSHFMLKSLAPLVRTEHMLTVQWDGYVLDPGAWRDEFLHYDYIGAPWPHVAEPNKVGNGGFSLRSRRLLLALQEPAFEPGNPEDVCICVTHRAALEARGIRFAPTVLASEFSVEEGGQRDGRFGFHGAYHLPYVLPPDEVLALIASLQPAGVMAHAFGNLLRNLNALARVDARYAPALAALEQLIVHTVEGLAGAPSLAPPALALAKSLIRYGQYGAAARLLRLRRQALGRRWAEPRLHWRLQTRRLLSLARRPWQRRPVEQGRDAP